MSHWLRTIPVALPRELPSAALGGARLVPHSSGHVVLYVGCPPASMLISVARCRRTYASREYAACDGCQLGPLRGATREADRSADPPMDLAPPEARESKRVGPRILQRGPRMGPLKDRPDAGPHARWLREERLAAGMSQGRLGLSLGHSSGKTVSLWELGHVRFGPAAIARIISALGCAPPPAEAP